MSVSGGGGVSEGEKRKKKKQRGESAAPLGGLGPSLPACLPAFLAPPPLSSPPPPLPSSK